VSRWVVLGGQHRWALHPVATTTWNGLSTEIDASTRSDYVAVVALNDHGRPIGHSRTVRVGG
jgi:hypothetical protein